MDTGLDIRRLRLYEALERLESAAVAFSAGVDSTFLLRAAHDVLGPRAVAVTARSCFVPPEEILGSERFCRENGIEQILFDADPLGNAVVASNPPDRCYHCKKLIFSRISVIAAERGLRHVLEGSNADDTRDYRPGMRAVSELGVLSPLKDAGLAKSDIRELSRRMGLPTWDKPSSACLASRIPYGDALTPERLSAVGSAERGLREMGFGQVRVRHHGAVARIELPPCDIPRAAERENAVRIAALMRGLGFAYAALDLEGYRTGSMNIGVPGAESGGSLPED